MWLRDIFRIYLKIYWNNYFFFLGFYEVNVIFIEDFDRFEFIGNYFMIVCKEYLCFYSVKIGERVLEWELDYFLWFWL